MQLLQKLPVQSQLARILAVFIHSIVQRPLPPTLANAPYGICTLLKLVECTGSTPPAQNTALCLTMINQHSLPCDLVLYFQTTELPAELPWYIPQLIQHSPVVQSVLDSAPLHFLVILLSQNMSTFYHNINTRFNYPPFLWVQKINGHTCITRSQINLMNHDF